MEIALSVGRFWAAVVIAGLGTAAGPAFGQEDLNRGKTPAQLYASDCVDCHKNPRSLGGRNDAGNLAGFLRVHYTASRESAAAIANYLASLGPAPSAARQGTAQRPRPATGQEQSKTAPAETAKPAEAAAPKPAEAAPEKPAAPAAEPAPAAAPAAPAAPPADPQ